MADQVTITNDAGVKETMTPDEFFAVWGQIAADHPARQRLLGEAMSQLGPPPSNAPTPAGLQEQKPLGGLQIGNVPIPIGLGGLQRYAEQQPLGEGVAGIALPLIMSRVPGASVAVNALKQALAGAGTAAIGQMERGKPIGLAAPTVGAVGGAVAGGTAGRLGSAAQSATVRAKTEKTIGSGLKSAYDKIAELMGRRVPLTPGQDIQQESLAWANVLQRDPEIANRVLGKQMRTLYESVLKKGTARPGTLTPNVIGRIGEMEFKQPGKLQKILGSNPEEAARILQLARDVENNQATLQAMQAQTTPGRRVFESVMGGLARIPGGLGAKARGAQLASKSLGGDVPEWLLNVARDGGPGAQLLETLSQTRGLPEAVIQKVLTDLYRTAPGGPTEPPTAMP